MGLSLCPSSHPPSSKWPGRTEAGEKGSDGTLGLHPLRGLPAEAGQGSPGPRHPGRAPAASHHHIMALHLRLLVRQLVVLHFEATRAGGAGSGPVPAQPPPGPNPRASQSH